MTRGAELLRLKESRTCIKDGYSRVVYSDAVHWVISRTSRVAYCIVRFPFVPDYHLCDLVEDTTNPFMPQITERPLQQFKTLAQALAVLRVITGSQS